MARRPVPGRKPASRLRIHSFAPIARADAEVLILGSMPGVMSLAASRYYAHPRNAFWPIMTRVLSIDPGAAYEERVRALVQARIAVWDVLHSCERTGSLDTSIDRTTQQPNDFASFFAAHPKIRRILLNGGKASDSFHRHFLAEIADPPWDVRKLPSTSPANASWTFERKLAAWREALTGIGKEKTGKGKPITQRTRQRQKLGEQIRKSCRK